MVAKEQKVKAAQEQAALTTQDAVDQVNALILELRDEVENKTQRNVEMRKIILQKDAMLVLKDVRIKALEQELAANIPQKGPYKRKG